MGVSAAFKALFKSPETAGTGKSVPVETPAAVGQPQTKNSFSGLLLTRRQTEKAVAGEAEGTYVFLVPAAATKPGVAQAFRALTGVNPTAVRILRYHASARGRSARTGQKKAMVAVPKGTTVKFPSQASKTSEASKTSSRS